MPYPGLPRILSKASEPESLSAFHCSSHVRFILLMYCNTVEERIPIQHGTVRCLETCTGKDPWQSSPTAVLDRWNMFWTQETDKQCHHFHLGTTPSRLCPRPEYTDALQADTWTPDHSVNPVVSSLSFKLTVWTWNLCMYTTKTPSSLPDWHIGYLFNCILYVNRVIYNATC